MFSVDSFPMIFKLGCLQHVVCISASDWLN